MIFIGAPTAAASASTEASDGDSSTSAEVSGRTFDESDGLEVTVRSYKTTKPGGLPVGQTWGARNIGATPQKTWGSSYATSTESLQYWFTLRVKAAGNVFNGKRYVKVCAWYQQGEHVASETICSSASSSGTSWSPGGEESLTIMDNLSLNWPQTVLWTSVTTINPNIY